MLLKEKKGTMLQENVREPYRCGTLSCVLFLVVYSCLLFWDLARFLCSFPLTCSYLSYLYSAFQAGFFFSPLKGNSRNVDQFRNPHQSWQQQNSWFENNLGNPGSWLTFQLFNDQSCRGIGNQALEDFEHHFHEIVSCLAETEGI